jgi:hypothetical protein
LAGQAIAAGQAGAVQAAEGKPFGSSVSDTRVYLYTPLTWIARLAVDAVAGVTTVDNLDGDAVSPTTVRILVTAAGMPKKTAPDSPNASALTVAVANASNGTFIEPTREGIFNQNGISGFMAEFDLSVIKEAVKDRPRLSVVVTNNGVAREFGFSSEVLQPPLLIDK